MPTKFNIKKITGIPLNFTGQVGKMKFRVIRSIDIYGKINATLEDIENGTYILSVDGTLNAEKLAQTFTKYAQKIDSSIDNDSVIKRMKPFFTQLNRDVKEENKKSTQKKSIPKKKKTVTKKARNKKGLRYELNFLHDARKKNPVGYQKGTTNIERDKKIQAKAPGKRKSASGRTYYEYRANRSDAGKLLGTHKDTKSHNVNIRVVSGMVGKHFKTYKIYKKHIIDYEITPSGKKWYVVSQGYAKVPFYTDSLTIAKKYVDRLISINKSK